MRTIAKLMKENDHVYVFCRGRNVVKRFLSDARAEGFGFDDPPEESDLFALMPGLNIIPAGWAGHVASRSGKAMRVDYEKYLTGAKNYLM